MKGSKALRKYFRVIRGVVNTKEILMDTNVVQELQSQLNRERQNAANYFFISSACSNLAFDGLAKFFDKQAQEELGHAKKFEDFLISKRIQPEHTALSGITADLSLPALTERAYLLEIGTTANLQALYDMAEGSGESQVCALLDWFLLEQIEEETWSFDLMDKVRRNSDAGWLILDEQYGNK